MWLLFNWPGLNTLCVEHLFACLKVNLFFIYFCFFLFRSNHKMVTGIVIRKKVLIYNILNWHQQNCYTWMYNFRGFFFFLNKIVYITLVFFFSFYMNKKECIMVIYRHGAITLCHKTLQHKTILDNN